MRFYFVRNTYFSQIEVSAVLGLRLGYTTMGLALWPRGKHSWPRWLPRLRLNLWEHTGQCDQRWIFRIFIGRFQLGYRTRGSAKPEFSSYYDAGWHFRRRPGRPCRRAG